MLVLDRLSRTALTLCLLAAVALAVGTAAGPARAAEPDYTGYQALLRRYVHTIHAKGQPYEARFDYEQIYIDENIWATNRADGLATLHGQLLSGSPTNMTASERTAWAINAYNFLTLERMTLNLLVPRRKFMRYDSPKQVNTQEGFFVAAPVATVDGVRYSLAGFERRFVYGDTASNPVDDGTVAREKGGDPRLQCALVKASVCSGPLLLWPYRADSLEAQLDRAARLALALPSWLRTDAAGGVLSASNRFFEERADIGGPEMPGLVPFLLKYAPPPARKLITARKLTRPNMFFEPDWKLNQFEHPRPALPGADTTRIIRKG